MFKMILKLSSSLDSCVAHVTNLDRVKFIPFSLMEFSIEVSNKFGTDKVKKSIAYIAIVLNILKFTV